MMEWVDNQADRGTRRRRHTGREMEIGTGGLRDTSRKDREGQSDDPYMQTRLHADRERA